MPVTGVLIDAQVSHDDHVIAHCGPQVAKYAGRAGDGFICTSGKGAELYVDQLMPAVREGLALRSDGRTFDEFDRMIEIKLSYEEDLETALDNTRFWSPLSLSKEQKHDITDPVEMERAADALPIEQIAKRWIVGTDPDVVAEQIGQYMDWGFNHLVFHAPGQVRTAQDLQTTVFFVGPVQRYHDASHVR